MLNFSYCINLGFLAWSLWYTKANFEIRPQNWVMLETITRCAKFIVIRHSLATICQSKLSTNLQTIATHHGT